MTLNQIVRQYRRCFKGLMKGHGFRDVPPTISHEAVTGEGDLYTRTPLDPRRLRFPGHEPEGGARQLTSALCCAEHLESAAFRYWIEQLHEPWRYHRKLWEFGFLCQAFYERGLLAPGKKGLAFAVGCEPLPALFASLGCTILATDLPSGDRRQEKWARTNQWAGELEGLERPNICGPERFRQNVSYRPVDMNAIPDDLQGFDFVWSACSFEHCGSIELGQRFIYEQMKCLKPGGVAVHSTEYNLSSVTETLTHGSTVIFRRPDIEEMCHRLRDEGHHVEPLDLNVGNHPLDARIDDKPYSQKEHLRLRIRDHASTSIALIIRKKA